MIMWLRRKKVLVFLCLFVTSVVAETESKIYPKLTLESGAAYLGLFDVKTNTEAFLGIPFAVPPVGSLRWSPPKPFVESNEIITAQSFAPACMQGLHIFNWYKNVAEGFSSDPKVIKNPYSSEDCLYLNIWRPSVTKEGEKLPAIIYIHGGSNKGGWSFEPNYIGDNLAKHGVVVITIAYRLGVFGYFSHPDLREANFGLLDQIHAVKWIHKHAKELGIDTSNIAIMGESAGASAATFMAISPIARKLFSKIIFQSGGFSLSSIASKSDYHELGIKFEKQLLTKESKNPVTELRNIDAKKVLAAAEVVYRDHFFQPVIDQNSLFSEVTSENFEMSLLSKDLLIGSNENEWLMYIDENQDLDDWLATEVSEESRLPLKALLKEDKNDLEAIDKLMSAKIFACPSLTLARNTRASGGKVWFYQFNRKRINDVSDRMGAYHGAELPYVFDKHDDWLPTVDIDRSITRDMQKYWTNFSKYGDPNSKTLSAWPMFEKTEQLVFYIGEKYFSKSHISEKFCEYL